MYKFKSKADGDLIMMAPVGDQILRLVGKTPAAQGIIECAALPAAIAALEHAVDAEERALHANGAQAAVNDDGRGGAVGVGLKQRAWPMLEMMRRALGERADIVWGV